MYYTYTRTALVKIPSDYWLPAIQDLCRHSILTLIQSLRLGNSSCHASSALLFEALVEGLTREPQYHQYFLENFCRGAEITRDVDVIVIYVRLPFIKFKLLRDSRNTCPGKLLKTIDMYMLAKII